MPGAFVRIARVALFLIATVLSSQSPAQGLVAVPPLTGHVVDAAGLLDSTGLASLEATLSGVEQSRGAQVVFLIVPTTQPEDIASFANRVGNTWKIGRKSIGDGVLLVVARNDRKVRLEVAKTLEGAIPDLAAKQIIDDAITPAFRQQQYAQGLQAAAEQIGARIAGESLPPLNKNREARGGLLGFNWEDLAVFLFFAVPIGASVLRRLLGRPLGALVTGLGFGAVAWVFTTSVLIGAVAAFVAGLVALLSSFTGVFSGGRSNRHGGGWSAGSGGWGSGGGGFSSGGGGDFGGGGASGDW